MQTLKEKTNTAFEVLKKTLNYSNVMQVPRIEKVVISTGVGSIKDQKKTEIIIDRLAKITGQKAASRVAKKAIATFKSREGDIVGYQTTLRGSRMQDFLERLIHIALPRTKDFRGINSQGIDSMGNLTIGIKEHTIFPETSDEDIKNVFGMSITIVTSAKTKKEALAFLTHLGIPFKKS